MASRIVRAFVLAVEIEEEMVTASSVTLHSDRQLSLNISHMLCNTTHADTIESTLLT